MLTWLERIARAIAALFGIQTGGSSAEVETLRAQLAASEEQAERYAQAIRELEADNATLRAALARCGDPADLLDNLARDAAKPVPPKPAP